MITKLLQKKHLSLSFKLPFLFFLSYFFIALIMVDITYVGFEHRMIAERKKVADGVTALMDNAIKKDMIDEYIERGYESEGYNYVLKYLYLLKDSYKDIKYMYIYRFDKDSKTATVVFDLDNEYTENPSRESTEWIGKEYEPESPFSKEIDKLISDRDMIVHKVKTREGEHLLSCVKPVFDSKGRYVCSACVDFDLSKMHMSNIYYALNIAVFLVACMVVIFTVNVFSVKGMIVKPIQEAIGRIKGFKYETEEDRVNNLHHIEAVDIQTGDEIEDFYHAYIDSMKESMYYMRGYIKASKEAKEMSILALRDELTGVGNKAEFNRTKLEIERRLAEEDYHYGIVMIDVNNLKLVNDKHGHDKGDIYLLGCCKIICDTFKHSPVCRIGGDEFVVVVLGDDYKDKDSKLKELKMRFRDAYDDTEKAWEKYSASIGYAEGNRDRFIDDVVIEADKLMYKDKIEFKKKMEI